MVKLPDYTALGTRLPQAVSSSPNFPSSDVSATSMARFGQTLQQVGDYWGKKTDIDNDALDLPKAESLLDAANIKTTNAFAQDSDYATMPQRAEAAYRQNLYGAAANIRNPRTRQIFIESRTGTQARQWDGVNDYSVGLATQQYRVEMNDTMKRFHDIYVDPTTKPEEKAKALADMQHTLDIGLKAAKLTPAEGDQMKSTFIDNAPWEKGKLAVRADSRAYNAAPISYPDIPPEGARLLNMIGRRESGNRYNILNGGVDTFDVNGDHPGRVGRGGTSTAAGRYQFVKGTWEMAVKALGLVGGMTPENQDRAAWWNAQRAYKEKTHGKFDLATDLKSGSSAALARIKRVLGGPNENEGEWTSLQKVHDEDFVREISNGETTFDHGSDTGGDPLAGAPDDVRNLPPDQRQDLIDLIKSEQAKDNVDLRAGLEVATQNAPAAIQNTGGYDGHIPTLSEFQQAYGAQEGSQRFDNFTASMDVAGKIYGFQRASNEEIAQTIEAATPRSSGDDAALETKVHAALSEAGAATLKARAADPAGYTMQAFPNIAQGFEDAKNATDPADRHEKMQQALAGMQAAQDKLGIPTLDQVLIPKAAMADAIDKFKDETLSPGDRLGAIQEMMGATNNPAQKKQIFDQAVRVGLPDITAAAFTAMERNEPGAAQRLFAAAMTDVSKLPGKAPNTADEINNQIQIMMNEGTVGDILYGYTRGEAGDTQEAERDSKLMSNYINLRIREGKTLQQASDMLAKDMWGDVEAYTDDGVRIVVGKGQDGAQYKAALDTFRPKIQAAVEAAHSLPKGPALDKMRAQGELAIAEGQKEVNTQRVMDEGYFWSHNGGYVFIDAYSGLAIGDYESGKALFFSADEVNKLVGQSRAEAKQAEKAAAAPLPEDQSAIGVLGQRVTDAIFGPLPGRETP